MTGLTAWQTSGTTSAGIRLLGGSSVKLRASSVLGNTLYGVHVTPFTDGVAVTTDVNKIDLGSNTTTEAGKNVVQAPTGASPNGGAGICLAVTQGVGAILNAQSVGVIGNAVNTNGVSTQACPQKFSAQ